VNHSAIVSTILFSFFGLVRCSGSPAIGGVTAADASAVGGSPSTVGTSITGGAPNVDAMATSPPSDPDAHADWLIAQMTSSEKVQLVHGTAGAPRGVVGYVPGITRLGIPSLYLADGSVGVGNSVGQATALPSSIASAASWDVAEAYKYGTVIGSDMRAYGINVNLGGNINLIGREPRDGRTFETKGEDPILAGKITAAHLHGIQDQHVMTGIKHFALNDQETSRTFANAVIDERSARESDLLAFEIGIKDSNVQSVMCAYNLVNGVYSCENSRLLNDILKGDWAFPGFVMSDWGATHSSYQAAIAGLDQEQPDSLYFATLDRAVQSGQLSQARLDNMVHRILRAMLVSGLFDYPSVPGPLSTSANETIAQEVEEQGAVLLKNAGGQLPLNPSASTKIAIIGSHADIAVLSGGGSAQVTPIGGAALSESNPGSWPAIWDPSSPLNAVRAMAPGATVQYDDGTNATSAATLANACDVAIVFVSQLASEGMDLPGLNFTDVIHSIAKVDQDALVTAVAAANPHTAVVMENGGAQVMPWLGSVSAVLEAWYPGQAGANAIANILFGKVNPSGKLPITFPASVNDLPRPVIPSTPDNTAEVQVNYAEGFNVGYKWFDANGLTPLFAFGFGLSYTTFAISNATVTNALSTANPGIQVTFNLQNTGGLAGAEVAQVYVGLPASTGEPPKRLIGWKKVSLTPGETQLVAIDVDANDSSHPFSYWDAARGAWLMATGDYTVYLGNSSRSTDLTLMGSFYVGP
jgi:beta-glucosidase